MNYSKSPVPTVAELTGEVKQPGQIPDFIPEPKRTRQERKLRRQEWWERFRNTTMQATGFTLLKHIFLHKKPEEAAGDLQPPQQVSSHKAVQRWRTNDHDDQGVVTVAAATKSEARALLKQRLGVPRLPAGLQLTPLRLEVIGS